MNEKELANYILKFMKKGLKDFKENYYGAEFPIESNEEFSNFDFKILKNECKKLNINLKYLKNKTILKTTFSSKTNP